VEAIGGTSSSQIPLPDVVYLPEPSTGVLLSGALAGLGVARRRTNRSAAR
jgi:hypothetical protein